MDLGRRRWCWDTKKKLHMQTWKINAIYLYLLFYLFIEKSLYLT